jgi:hypothetical protein
MSKHNRTQGRKHPSVTLANPLAPKDETKQEAQVTETSGSEAPATQPSEAPVAQDSESAAPAPRILDDLSQQNAATKPEGEKKETSAEGKKDASVAKAPKGPTKKGRVFDMCAADGGATIDAIAAALGIGKIAARSLIGDLRRDGNKVEQEKGVYRVAAKA